ncbi:MAG: AIR synthase-related protein [Butyrivibrio sp.]|nr:AIR synthase-related protein [Butyrivibrio sp.]MCM1343061.1 AIR synthase-related protein [Muribaculaceae bacterium]
MKIGKISTNILKRSVLRQIGTRKDEVVRGAGIGGDCALFAFSDEMMIVSCMQEAALTVPESAGRKSLTEEERAAEAVVPTEMETAAAVETGTLTDPAEQVTPEAEFFAERRTMTQLIQKCANNLAAQATEPIAILITLLLPESLEEAGLKALMAEADKVCEELHIQIAGGQTRVTGAVTGPYGVVTGIGKMQKATYRSLKAAAPGQDVVISKWIGLEGTAHLARRYREKLLERYPAWLVEEAAGFDRFLSVIPEAATAVKSGVCAMHDVSEGGIFGALWELAESAGVGLTIDLKKLPLRQETVEVCEYCNVNPYELLSGGCLLMTSEDGIGLVSGLKAAGIPAVMVGKVTDSNDRILINEEEVRYLDRPGQDQIYG